MSEQRIRELASHHPECRYPYNLAETECLCGYQYAMSFDPDVVTVLRWLEEYSKRLVAGCKEYPISSQKRLAMEVTRSAIDAVFEWTSKQFHVRLTDDGWEWTDE